MKKVLVLALVLMSASSYAQLLKVGLTCTGDYDQNNFCNEIESQFQNEINNQDVPEAPIGKFAEQMANAVSISTAGTGSDYANLFDIFVIGIHPLAIGADIDMDNVDNAETAGVALSPSMMVGVNLDLLPVDKVAGIELKKLDLFFSYFSQKNDKLVDEDGTTVGGEISNFATHIRYRWLDEASVAAGLFKWNGVQLHTGYRYAKNELNASYDIGDIDPTAIDMNDDGSNDVTMNLNNAIAEASIESSAHTIPVEISTSARVLYLFTFFTGAGFDYNISSKSEIDVTASGDISSTNASGVTGSVTGDIVANQNSKGDGAATNFRGFFGVQANLLNLKLAATVNKSLTNDTLAANVGVRFAW